MDRKKLKKYLATQKYINSKIASYNARISTIAKLSASYEGEKVFTSRKIQDKEAEQLARLRDELDEKVKEFVEEGNKEFIEITHLIDKISDPIYKTILHEMYLQGKYLPDIGNDIGYSYRHICRLHGNALAEWDKL